MARTPHQVRSTRRSGGLLLVSKPGSFPTSAEARGRPTGGGTVPPRGLVFVLVLVFGRPHRTRKIPPVTVAQAPLQRTTSFESATELAQVSRPVIFRIHFDQV